MERQGSCELESISFVISRHGKRVGFAGSVLAVQVTVSKDIATGPGGSPIILTSVGYLQMDVVVEEEKISREND